MNYVCAHVHVYTVLTYTQTAVDTLMMKFTTTIHDQAYAVVAEHVKVQTCTVYVHTNLMASSRKDVMYL